MSEPNALDVLSQLTGRSLLTPPELLKELHQAGWPDHVLVHPADFLALAPYFAMARDEDGLYFNLANAQIRPGRPYTGQSSELNLTDYAGPSNIVLPEWSGPK